MERFNVEFSGRLLDGADPEQVKLRLAKLLKLDPATVERLFTDQPVFIKKNTDREAAEKIVASMERIGAQCSMVPLSDGVKPQAATAATIAQPADPVAERSATRSNGFILTNVETVPGKRITEHYGLVSGSTIRAKNIGRDLMASLKNIVGGELKGYTQLLSESRSQAVERMTQQAKQLGANAIINVRFSTSSVAQGAAELYAYGTAVRVE